MSIDAATIAAAQGMAGRSQGAGMSSQQVNQMQQQQGQQKQKEDQKKQMLIQILSPEARERLATVRLVKPEKADNIESYLLQQAQSGKLRSQVQEGQLIEMMEQLSEQSKAASKVTFSRRKVNSGWSDSEDDDDSDLL